MSSCICLFQFALTQPLLPFYWGQRCATARFLYVYIYIYIYNPGGPDPVRKLFQRLRARTHESEPIGECR